MGFNTKVIFALSLFTHNCCNSSNYKEYDLRKDNVCKKQLEVGQGNHSSIIIRQFGKFDDWDWKKDFECTFFVKANFNMGLFAVIQKMNLRRDVVTNHCIDYIKFRHGQKKNKIKKFFEKDEEWGAPICGRIETLKERLTVDSDDDSDSEEETEIVPHAFQQPDGEIEIKLHISRQMFDEISSRDLLMEIVLTSYTKCKVDQGAYKLCGQNACIYKDYFNDGIVNCPFVNSFDEYNFVTDGQSGSGFMSTKVAITAVSSIFLSFFVFLACILMCRYMELMCWSGSNRNRDRGTELSQVEPTAPPPEAPPSPDKDLPPAYETLFPQS